MITAQFAVLAALSAVSIALCAYLLAKVRTITYLLEQPVVKKMSPQLKLKPVKVDELDDANRANPSRNAAPSTNGAQPARAPRPGFEGGERPPRENRDRAPRTDRPEGEARREGGFDRGPRNDRGDRGDRFGGGGREGGRDRGGRHERNDRGDRFGGREGGREGGGGREGNREGGRERTREPFNGEPAAAEASRPAPVVSESAPVQQAPAALSPRRPLPSTVDNDNGTKDASVDALAPNPTAEDALFVRNDEDITHGRRHQPKKKPRFNVEEEEVKEETKAL